MIRLRTLLPAALTVALAACTGADPGPLEGTWNAREPFPVTVTFRDGEAESMGRVRKVSYERGWGEVRVIYAEGGEDETSFLYTVVDDDTLQSESGTFRRVR